MTILNNLLFEAESAPKVLLVQKHIWMNYKSDESTVIGWQTKQGMYPDTNRGLMVGDILAGYYERHGAPTYRFVINGSELIKMSIDFTKKELNDLINAKVLKVLLK